MEPSLDADSAQQMFETIEGWHTTDDGVKLYTKSWKPKGETKARVVFIHGFSDHCNTAYDTLFVDLNRRGIAIHAWDQRGWGLSVHKKSDRGRTGPTSQVMSDIAEIISLHVPPKAAPDDCKTPLFVMGHSMGGAQTLVFASPSTPLPQSNANIVSPDKLRSYIRGYICESPFLGFSPRSQPWAITEAAGRVAGKVFPNVHMVNKLDTRLLSHDQSIGKLYENDTLCHDTGTLEGLAGLLDRANALREVKVKVEDKNSDPGRTWSSKDGKGVAVLVCHGDGDEICSFEAAKTYVEDGPRCGCLVKDKTFKNYPGWYHQLHSEAGDDKHRYARDIGDWILERCSEL